MPEQVNEPMSPGQAIYDALSDEAKAAVDALPDDVLGGEDGVAAAKIMAATARTAHSVNPVGWLISPDGPTNGRRRPG